MINYFQPNFFFNKSQVKAEQNFSGMHKKWFGIFCQRQQFIGFFV